jgi:hypothetical protein
MAGGDDPDPGQFRPGEYFTGAIIMRLRPELRTLRSDDLLHDTARSAAPGLWDKLKELGVKSAPRLVTSVDLDTLFELERTAAENTGSTSWDSLACYWRCDMTNWSGDMREAVAALLKIPEVEDAYLDIHVVPAGVNPSGDPLSGSQGYLNPQPDGIDARWAWTLPGGDGSGVGLADLENGWNVNHDDLAPAGPTLIAGVNLAMNPGNPPYSPAILFDGAYKSWNHGTSALGVIAARNNPVGIVGIAPNIGPIRLASVWNGSTPGHVVDALTATVASLSPGDVVMLELQTANQGPGQWPNNYPIEVKDAERNAIRLAISGRNLVVIAAAGNNGDDLDNYVSPQGTSVGKRVFNRNSADFEDSGSIMVGAATSAAPHQRMSFSNFGSRIDCYGWGENVSTCGAPAVPDLNTHANRWYRTDYNGTSAATPIVAGAAALLQGINKASTGMPIPSAQMRALLSDPANGTAPGPGLGAKIGVMPDLRKLTTALALTPDIVIRDFVGDDGASPSSGTLAKSPDIIVRNAGVTNPQADFGQGSFNANRDDLDSPVVAGSNATIYLRGTNRGGNDAIDVVGKAWWSEPATLVTPDLWNFIGQTASFTLPADHSLVVSPPIAWANAPLGHVCLVATIGCANDPAPIIPKTYDIWSEYENLIRSWNNIAWRNIITVPTAGKMPQPLHFRMVGAPKTPQLFDVDVDLSMPEGSEIVLEIPGTVVGGLLDNPNIRPARARGDDRQSFVLPFRGTVRLRNVRLPPGSGNMALLTVTPAAGAHTTKGRIVLKQRLGDIEAGGITWRFVEGSSAGMK